MAACLGYVVHLRKLEGDAEAAEEDGDVGAGTREVPCRHRGLLLLLGDGRELLERRADPPQRLVRLVGPHRHRWCLAPPRWCPRRRGSRGFSGTGSLPPTPPGPTLPSRRQNRSHAVDGRHVDAVADLGPDGADPLRKGTLPPAAMEGLAIEEEGVSG